MVTMSLLHPLENWPVDNLAAAVTDGETVLAETGDTSRVFELASVTKLLSAYGVLMAVEEGVFELDTPCGPEGSTVRHLLAHASGVGFRDPEPERAVGERRLYSSAGFEILADAVGRETGIEFPDYLAEGVFEPLGMSATELHGSAGHGAVSTVADLTAFAEELAHPRLLAAETLEEAFSPQFPELNGMVPGYGFHKPCLWGLGFEIADRKSPHWTGPDMPRETVGHFGMSGTYLWAVPAVGRFADLPGAGTAMVALTDRRFQDWVKPLWERTNEYIWQELQRGR
ncbi:serine hydrolase domain-containing protein [Corynebacterium frankenforstense]